MMSEHTFPSWDGTRLFYRARKPRSAGDKAVLLFHRGHEHSGRLVELAERLDLEDAWVFAWDQRGHGRSPGERGWAADLRTLVKDVESFVRFIRREHSIPAENMAAVGYSVGGVLAAAWVHDYAPPLRALVLAAPAFRVKLYVPFALPLLRLKARLLGKSFVKSYVKSRMLTHDPEQARAYDEDTLISRNIAVNVLIDLFDVSTRLIEDAGAIRVPTLVLGAGADWVVQVRSQRDFFERLSSPVKDMKVYPDFHHAIFHEKDRHLPIARAREFLLEAFRHPPENGETLLGAHRAEYERLSRPLPLPSPRRAVYAGARAALKTVGRLSRGIRVGWRTGFDSGQSLDYVYENIAQGLSPLGRLIDRAYLNSIGWKGIRRRKVNLRRVLETAVKRVAEVRQPVRIVDIASGPGRYLLETLKELQGIPVSALLRDRSGAALEVGRALARRMDLENAEFAEGDAFDPASLAAIRPRPDIAVVSGLYELFPDDERVLRSLRGLTEALPSDGILVYTNQPWHPQVEFIARVLRNRDGKPWVMRRRSQAEMDELVRSAGLEKEEMEIDPWGIFTVSLARKRSGPTSGS